VRGFDLLTGPLGDTVYSPATASVDLLQLEEHPRPPDLPNPFREIHCHVEPDDSLADIRSASISLGDAARISSDRTLEIEDDLESRPDQEELVRGDSDAPYYLSDASVWTLPGTMTALQGRLFDLYVHNFSKAYPTCLEDSTPFLTTYLPLAMHHDTVRSGLLALSGLYARRFSLHDLKLEGMKQRGHALRGCHALISKAKDLAISNACTTNYIAVLSDDEQLCLVATVTLLFIYDKLSGFTYSLLKPHLNFASHFYNPTNCLRYFSSPSSSLAVHHTFFRRIFSYSDMLASVALGRPGHYTFDIATFNSIPVGTLPSLLSTSDTFYFPALISRVTLAVQDVRLADIDRWPSGLGWLPSYSSEPFLPSARVHRKQALEKRPPSLELDAETNAVHAFYRLTAKTYFFRRLREPDLPMTVTTLAYPPFIAQRRLDECTEEAINVLAQIPSLSRMIARCSGR